ncbi:MAG: DUF3623 family protein [Desulfobacterales bacterium]|nr:DUF3623 family protein [Desulfobacterales bacterium]
MRRADSGGRGRASAGRCCWALPLLLAWAAGGLHATLDDASVAGVYIALPVGAGDLGLDRTCLPVRRHHRPEHAPLPARRHRAGSVSCAPSAPSPGTRSLLVAAPADAAGLWPRDAANPFGLWTFAVLFFARVSAKLNLFFGVPRINTEFLPRPLAHLPSHFRIAPDELASSRSRSPA